VYAVVTSIICSLILNFSIYITITRIINSDKRILRFRNILLILILSIIETIFYSEKYSIMYMAINCLSTILFTKLIFRENMIKTIISSSMAYIVLMISDFISSLFFLYVTNLDTLRSVWYFRIISNFVIAFISYGLISIPPITKKCKYFIERIKNHRISTISAFFILIVVIILITYSLSKDSKLDISYFSNIFIVLYLILFCYIFINENNQYNKLNDEYDSLFKYIQVFEDWIEKEQLNRHEYRNQLSSLRCITKEKKLRDKIDSILLDNINITNDTVNQLKPIPNGGLKGLLYYKISVAESKKIHVELDISIKKSDQIKKMSEDNMKTLCRLIGIYLDNAIEGAIETRKKILSIEIYDFDSDINVVITNTFNNKNDISRRNEKGYTTKGEGHGKGLYFANKLLNKNQWLKEEQSIMANYYIQRLIIKK